MYASSLVWIAVNRIFYYYSYQNYLVCTQYMSPNKKLRYLYQCSGERIGKCLMHNLSRSKLAYERDKSLRNLHLIY